MQKSPITKKVRKYLQEEAKKISLHKAKDFFYHFDNSTLNKWIPNHRTTLFDQNGKWINFDWCKSSNPFTITVVRTDNDKMFYYNSMISKLFVLVIVVLCNIFDKPSKKISLIK